MELPDVIAVTPIEYRCARCSEPGHGARAPGNWWSYPQGWFMFVAEEKSALVCSSQCAAAYDAAEQQRPCACCGEPATIELSPSFYYCAQCYERAVTQAGR